MNKLGKENSNNALKTTGFIVKSVAEIICFVGIFYFYYVFSKGWYKTLCKVGIRLSNSP